MDGISNRKEMTSFSGLDDWIQHIYFFENVVLKRSKNDKHFTEQEIIDMIGKDL